MKSEKERRNKIMRFRVNQIESDLLDELQRKTGMTKTQLMVRGLKIQYNLCRYHAKSFFELPQKVRLMEDTCKHEKN